MLYPGLQSSAKVSTLQGTRNIGQKEKKKEERISKRKERKRAPNHYTSIALSAIYLSHVIFIN